MSAARRESDKPRAPSRTQRLRQVAGLLLLGAAFGYLFGKRIGWSELLDTLLQFDFGYSFHIITAQASFHFLGATALWVLASGSLSVKFLSLVSSYWRSLMIGYWTPAGIGEMSFAWFHRYSGVKLSESLALLTVDKVVTLGVTALLGIPVFWLAPARLSAGRDTPSAAKAALAMIVGSLVVLIAWLLWRRTNLGERWQGAFRRYFTAISRFSRDSPWLLIANASVTLVRAAAAAAAYWWAIASFGGSFSSPFWTFLVVVSGARVLALVLPAPNGLGVFEVALIELTVDPAASASSVLSGALLVRLASLLIVSSSFLLPSLRRPPTPERA